MNNQFVLSRNEMEIMRLFWNENRPLSKSDIVDLSVGKSWKASSVYVLLKSLLSKGAIEEHGFFKSNTNIGRTFAATLSERDYVIMQINVSRQEGNLSLVDLVAGLIDCESDKNVVRELEKMIQERLK